MLYTTLKYLFKSFFSENLHITKVFNSFEINSNRWDTFKIHPVKFKNRLAIEGMGLG